MTWTERISRVQKRVLNLCKSTLRFI